MTYTRLIMVSALFSVALGCAEQKATEPLQIKVDMTLPDRDAAGGPQLFWIDIVRNEGTVQYRVREKLVSEEELSRLVKRVASINARHPIVIDRLEGVGRPELDHLAKVLTEAGALNISRRGEENQAVPMK